MSLSESSMLDILEAIKPKIQTDHVTDGVFYATLYRLGREDHRDCPPDERAELLNYLDKQNENKN